MKRPTILARAAFTTTACCFFMLVAVSWAQETPEPIDELIGLWGAERSLGPEVTGTLIVERSGKLWRADIQGYSASGQMAGDTVRLELVDSKGTFEGQLSADGNSLDGHWFQPGAVIELYRYATPVSLSKSGENRWQGDVQPRRDNFSLYLKLYRDDTGAVRALLRNPERNIGRFFRFGKVELSDGRLQLFDQEDAEVILSGSYSANTDGLTLYFPFQGVSFDFSRRDRNQAPGFYPRTREQSTYTYRPPFATDDGWPVAHLETVGLSVTKIEELVQSVLDTEVDSARTPYIQGVLIARHGKLVLDEYFYGFHREQTHDTRSSAKNLTSLLIGIALDRGAPFALESKVLDLFSDYKTLAHRDENKRRLEVRHLLSMSSGFDCDDNDSDTPGSEDVMQSQQDQPDWYRYALDLPTVRPPGEQGVYCTGGINLLGGILGRTTGGPLETFLAQQYARPLEIDRYHLNLQPTGEPYMGGGIRFRPRDHLKMGQLILDNGRWKAKQVVSAKWIEQITAPHASVNEENDYGYTWWRKTLTLGNEEIPVSYASGNGGQLVIAVPSLDLVVLFAGGNYGDYRTWSQFLNDLVPRYVLPAVVER